MTENTPGHFIYHFHISITHNILLYFSVSLSHFLSWKRFELNKMHEIQSHYKIHFHHITLYFYEPFHDIWLLVLMSFSTFLVFVPHVFYNMTWCHIIWGSPKPQAWAKPIGDFSHLSRNCIMTKPTQNNKPKSETIALTNVLKIRPNRSTNQFVGRFNSNGLMVELQLFQPIFF